MCLIPAHNEAATIAETVLRLPRPVYVIADNCTDATARLAADAGAVVYERSSSSNGGKGAALAWFAAVAASELGHFDAIVVLDADSRIDDNYADAIAACFSCGALAAQGFIQPVGAERSPASTLAAYSELLSERIGDNIRARLGWTVHLRGKGMALRPDVFRQVVSRLRTRAEDIEMSLALAGRGVRVHWVPDAVLYDPEPADAGRVSGQRARWLHGLLQVWRYYWRDILRLALTGGPPAWALLWAVVVKPKTLLFAAKAAVFVVLLALSLALRGMWLWPALTGLLGLSLAVDLAYYGVGLFLVEERSLYARALLRAPLYLLVWLRSLVLMRLSRGTWLRARD